MSLGSLPREGFLKVVGAAGLAGASLPMAAELLHLSDGASAAAAAAAPASGPVTMASHFAIFTGTARGQTLANLRSAGPDKSPPEMLAGVPELVFSPTRVKYPMVRQGFLTDGFKSDPAQRGKEGFVRVSWDEALTLVANEIKRVRTSYGNHAIYAGSYGWQSAGSLGAASTLLHRLMNGYGGYVDATSDYSTMAAQRILPHVVGSLAVYEQQTAWPVVLKNTQLIVLWGADLIQNNKIDWVTPDHYVYEVLPKLKASGIRVVSINPFKTETDTYLGAEWHPVRPATDVAVMLGMAHTLIEEKLVDRAFLAKYTVGFDKFEPYVMGQTDGVAKTPQWAEGISQVPAQAITQLARDMAHHRTMIMAGWGIQRQDHGEQVHWMLVTLASMLGQIGQPGGGFGFSYHYCSGGSPTSKGPALAGISPLLDKSKMPSGPTWLAATGMAIPVTRWVEMLLNPGKTIHFDGQKITYPDIKMILWAGGNPFTHHQHTNRVLTAWRKPQTIVVNEISWTPTARYADIVLPATTTLERNDITSIGSYSNLGFVAMKQVFAPVAEAKSDYWIYSSLAAKLGFGTAYTDGGKSEMAWIQSFYDTARKAAAAQHLTMPTFDAFWKEGILEFPSDPSAQTYVTYAAFRADPESNPLSTPSGKIEIYSSTIAGFKYADCPPHPTWLEPTERLGTTAARQYPLALITPHPKYRLHSQLDNTPMEQQLAKVNGRAPIWIAPRDAAARGLKTGDVARVFNARGQLLASVIVTDRLTPSVVRMEEGSWYDALHPQEVGGLDKEGSPNVLTLDQGTSQLAQGETVNACLVQVQKYTAKTPPITVYSPPPSA